MYHKASRVLTVFFTIFVTCPDASLAKPNNIPPASESSGYRMYPFHNFVTFGSLQAYRTLIRPSKGASCPMHPSCSTYAYKTFTEHNPFKAYFMTADHLHRCGHDLVNYETTEVNNFVRYVDPLTEPRKNEIPNSPQKLYPRESSVPRSSNKEEDRIYSYATTLHHEGNYKAAVIEFRRILMYYPETQLRLPVTKSISYCFFNDGLYLDAVSWAQDVNKNENIEPIEKDEMNYLIGLSYFHVKNYSLARNYFDQLASQAEYKDQSVLMTGIAHAREMNWAKAENTFSTIDSSSSLFPKAQELKLLAQNGNRIKFKSTTTAGVLSIVPGLGYLYDGYPQTALSAFLVNSLFIWGTHQAFENNNQGLGYVMAILSFGWYTGNIYGSVVTAQRKNLKTTNDYLYKFTVGVKY